MKTNHLLTRLAVFASLSIGLSPATAQTRSAKDVQAKRLRLAAMREIKHEEDCGEAMKKLQKSRELFPSDEASFWIAHCEEALQLSESARAKFDELCVGSRTDYRDLACQRRDELTPKITVVPSSAPPGFRITWNGSAADESGGEEHLVTGSTEIVASAPDHTPWAAKVVVSGSHTRVHIDIPPLRPQPLSPWRGAALSAGAFGLVSSFVGLGFGIHAKSVGDGLSARCGVTLSRCEYSAPAFRKQGELEAATLTAATASVLGGVGLVAGVVLWLVARPTTTPAGNVALSIGPSGTALAWQF